MRILAKTIRIAVFAVLTLIGATAGAIVFTDVADRALPRDGLGPSYSQASLARRDKIDALGFAGLVFGGLAGPVLAVALKRIALKVYWFDLLEGRELWSSEPPQPPPTSPPIG
jgi:hypothetical protein